ncbi:recombinase [Pseudoflavonifractor sp. 524-17]|uniref:recombinase family protein n=1 Tax=Pseudoflavonifractor sp. 524-17 TaxID=2304577 RepID=UPI0013799CB1|nr:recombinase family protein [Pseudoflavonifractor sp. 524-17]NCE66315.1 recombinase [Pseudoflavonifractor sp. 524-17]
MARQKNRGYQQILPPTYATRRWKMGGYIRLSREDLQKINRGLDDSNSVKNQRDILNDFHFNHAEEFESYTEYVDDGHTGTDTERESFQRLLGDVMSGKITCVVVKDLSRFARNYSDAGSLIDNLFVQMGVRFISLAEGVDSYLNPDSVNSIIVPITNVMNDQYCYQTSKKIRQVFDYKRRNGQYIGSFAPYGYIKDPANKHQLLVDTEAAEIVKRVYSMLLQGSSKRAIALYLNEHGIPSPTAYRRKKGLPVSSAVADDPMWGARMIHEILTNPIYTGDLVQGRRRVKSYKVHQIQAVPEEEWVRVPDTHEAIITHETFDKVQALLVRDTRTSPKGREVHLFSGFLKCADCGKSITRSQSGKNIYYACSTYKNRSRTACSMHSIKHNRLEAAVLFAIQYQVNTAVSYSELIARINSAPLKKSQSHRLNDQIAAKEKELTRITRYKQSLYQDWKDGEITQQEYRDMKADYERQAAELADVLARLNAERAELLNGVDKEHPALVAFAKYQSIETLTREILTDLVDHIKIYENGNISVHFKFADEFRRVAEYIEVNTTDTAEAG